MRCVVKVQQEFGGGLPSIPEGTELNVVRVRDIYTNALWHKREVIILTEDVNLIDSGMSQLLRPEQILLLSRDVAQPCD